MEKLFGVPINQFMLASLAIFAVGVAVMGLVALRNRVVFKLAVRNIPRRRAQTALIVLGLMLATLLFSASFATGDTLTHSIRTQAVSRMGEVDEVVRAEVRDVSGRFAYFDQSYFQQVQETLSGQAEVEGVAPLARERAPVVAPGTRLSEPQVDIMGMAEESMGGFSRLEDTHGKTLSLDALNINQAYISSELAQKLDVSQGDTIQVFLGPQPTNLEVAEVYVKGANPADELSITIPLERLQSLTGNEGMVNSILVTNRGGIIKGARHTDAVVSSLKPVLEGTGLEAAPVKQDALKQADEIGSMFASIFLLFGQFSIAAGILLIFLIFVMLAAERQRELGIARAVGMQRGHVIRMFAFEGTIYALLAAAVGSLLGVVVGWGMVRIMAVAFGQMDFDLTYTFNWRSVLIAYTMGMAFTFVVVLISSWRVSRLNIVRAIRDIPEPRTERRSTRRLILLALMLVLGVLLTLLGFRGEQAGPFFLGTSLLIIGVPLLAQRFGLHDRAAYTVAGLGLMTWWLLPASWAHTLMPFLPDFQMGIEMFFLSGIMIVLGAVWAVVYNSDILLAATVFLFGRIRGLSPVLKTAVSYPMQSRFRTGVTLAMFSLVVFTLVVMAFILNSMAALFEDTERLSGGFDIRATTSYANPIVNIWTALEKADNLNASDFQAVGSFTNARIKVKQDGSSQEPVDYFIQGLDTGYTDNVRYGFAMMADGYDSAHQVWQALQTQPGTAVVSAGLVPTKTNFNVGGPSRTFQLEGFWQDDEALPEVYILAADPRTGSQQRLRVIGVLEESAIYVQGILTSQQTVNALQGLAVPPQAYMLQLNEGVDADATAKALKAAFLEHGMQAEVMAEEIRKGASTNLMINNLLQGFMGLGLVVGIAALGVIAARSVVERRQQIGVLRALGFQKGMVQLSFLLESSFIALLGIAIGIALGAGVSIQVVNEMAESFEGLTFHVPWSNILVVVIIAYGASLLTTYLPARQAANVYPAEALRFE
ncbi:MAG: FtsX-like permease family protein [Chloroflexi bacterium]|nr:FtsX-like permease family protein [Chloroflexota bacterium]